MSGVGPYGSQPGSYGQGSPGEYSSQYGPYSSQYGQTAGPYGEPSSYLAGAGGTHPPAPPLPNQYQTHLSGTPLQAPPPPSLPGQAWAGAPSTWTGSPQPVPQPAAPRSTVNGKQIGMVALALALVAAMGIAVGIIIQKTGPEPAPAPTPTETSTPSPSPTPTPSHSRKVVVSQNLEVEWPSGWNVRDQQPEKGSVTFHYGKGKAWVQIAVVGNTPPWDPAHKCGNVLGNWERDPAKHRVSNVHVTVGPTRVPAPDGFNVGQCALSAVYVNDVSRLRHYSWYGIYRVSDGLNLWMFSEVIDGAEAPPADLEFFQQQVVKAVTTAP